MHEFGLMQSALDSAIETAAKNGAERIRRILLRVGDMSGVVPEALASAFETLSRGTKAEGAALDIDRIQTICRCSNCQTAFSPDDVIYICPHCGEFSAEVQQGRELELASLEVS